MAVSNVAPFTIKLRIFPGGDPQDASTWTNAQDISNYVRYPGGDGGQVISYSAGRGDEAARVDAGRMDLTLDNRDGRFTPRNPYGPYYGLLKRGTPIILSMINGEDAFTRTVASGLGINPAGQTWTASSAWSVAATEARNASVANSISMAKLNGADLLNGEGRFTVSASQVSTGGAWQTGVMIRSVSSTGGVSLQVDFNLSGALGISIKRQVPGSGTIGVLAENAAFTTYAANDKFRMRWQADGGALRLKVWKPATPATPDADEPAAWSLSATLADSYGTGVGLFILRGASTNVGMYVAFDDWISEATEFTGTVSQWPAAWNQTGNNAWATISASGPLRRLQQGVGALKSPLARQLPFYNPTGYWTMEDGPQASVFGAAVSGTEPAFKSGATVQPSGDTSLTGGGPAPVLLNATASIRGGTNRRQTGTGFASMFFAKLASLPAANTRLAQFRGTGRVNIWNIYIDNLVNMTVEGIAEDGTVVVNNSASFLGNFNPLLWVAYNLTTTWVAGTITWELSFHQVGQVNFSSLINTYSSSGPSRVNSWQLGGGASDLSGTAFAHVWLGENTLPFSTTDFSLVSDGWRSESAGSRLVRVARESRQTFALESGFTEPMGPQRAGTFLDVAADCEEADYGILYESGSGLGYRPRTTRYNRPVGMPLSVAAGQVTDTPYGIEDDQRLRNDWTVSRDEGSYAQVRDTASILQNGLYDDSTQINAWLDGVLPNHAGWRVFLGTREELRWPGIAINLARSPELIPAWRAAPYGFRLTVASGLAQVIGSDPDVIVEGYGAQLWPHGWRINFNCSPARPWDSPVVGSSLARAAAVDQGSTLAAGVTAAATSLSVATTAGQPLWNTTTLSYDIMISGERMTVTGVTGASSPQTFTVIRGVNSVNKPLGAGAAVQVYPAPYVAF